MHYIIDSKKAIKTIISEISPKEHTKTNFISSGKQLLEKDR